MKQSGPWRITFDTNPDDCNLSCIMCEDHSPYSQTKKNRIKNKLPRRRMDFSLIREMLLATKDSPLKEIIPSTMGEPLVYKQFENIIGLCHEFNIKLNLTTNGTFPRKGVRDWATLLLPVTSDIKISWNGATKATQEKIMLGTKWEKVLDNVKQLVAMRNAYIQEHENYCSITLQLTFLETNIHELVDIVLLGINLGVDRIKGCSLCMM
ncbi:MAG: radical SAM protein [Legionellales bacterium]|nr:MAG: radical SAM protein [Legionellales bacterium]